MYSSSDMHMSYIKNPEATGGLNRYRFCMQLCCDAYMYAAADVPDGSTMKEAESLV